MREKFKEIRRIIDDPNTSRDKIEVLNFENNKLGSKIAILKDEIGLAVRTGFLDRRRKILKARAELSARLLSVCREERDLMREIEAAGASTVGSPFHDEPSHPMRVGNLMQEWLEKFNRHKFENNRRT